MSNTNSQPDRGIGTQGRYPHVQGTDGHGNPVTAGVVYRPAGSNGGFVETTNPYTSVSWDRIMPPEILPVLHPRKG